MSARFGDVDPRAVRARVYIVNGEYALADTLLQNLIDQAMSGKRWVELVSLNMWHAATLANLGDAAGAREAIRVALAHGQRGGIIRSFATPEHDLTSLVSRVGYEMAEIESTYLQSVVDFLSAGAVIHTPRTGESPALPLSVRETEVLTLLQRGSSNREIADHLFITERTAKKHVGNILRKLGVTNRTAAAARHTARGPLRR